MRDERAFLFDILDSARLAMSYLQGIDLQTFLANTQLQDAVLRRLEIIGEAIRHITEPTRAQLGAFPWPQMTGMRNILAHVYFGVDLKIVWETVNRDLPSVIEATSKYLDEPTTP